MSRSGILGQAMKTSMMRSMAVALAVLILLVSDAFSQALRPPGSSPEVLDQILAPIAQYPDALVSQILLAATYPLEVVQADQWLQDPANAALSGDQLAAALDRLPWEPSVKSLLRFPQILRLMDGNRDWMERLGDAFLADQAGVMDSIQRLRHRAKAAGGLSSTPQAVVTTQVSAIEIEPARPDMVYIPVYDPQLVYGV
ncbi:DUF3300 domain-containing protein [Cupriavidus sp. D39]|uniref:DUF3300 domain-containing protein n=1 Tax=Cupriavidus sp. D39 TaxID=2997877 RepID=UPI00226D6B5A|nr:DUF3300 domain-containing protein [Cupriavidus sp. D39]MCY0853576.1 DUF3300 domain-containing protein [Cupriavidus sp. D39]